MKPSLLATCKSTRGRASQVSPSSPPLTASLTSCRGVRGAGSSKRLSERWGVQQRGGRGSTLSEGAPW